MGLQSTKQMKAGAPPSGTSLPDGGIFDRTSRSIAPLLGEEGCLMREQRPRFLSHCKRERTLLHQRSGRGGHSYCVRPCRRSRVLLVI